jgi:hypothetical protein
MIKINLRIDCTIILTSNGDNFQHLIPLKFQHLLPNLYIELVTKILLIFCLLFLTT